MKMNPENFCHWLDGVLGVNKGRSLNKDMVAEMESRLREVLNTKPLAVSNDEPVEEENEVPDEPEESTESP